MGIEVDHPENGAGGMDERRSGRAVVNIPVFVRDISSTHHVGTITDISDFGCRVASRHKVMIGRLITIDVPSFSAFTGWVVWTAGETFGLDFSNPVPLPVVDHLIGMSGEPRR